MGRLQQQQGQKLGHQGSILHDAEAQVDIVLVGALLDEEEEPEPQVQERKAKEKKPLLQSATLDDHLPLVPDIDLHLVEILYHQLIQEGRDEQQQRCLKHQRLLLGLQPPSLAMLGGTLASRPRHHPLPLPSL